jgi:hypothetical protein
MNLCKMENCRAMCSAKNVSTYSDVGPSRESRDARILIIRSISRSITLYVCMLPSLSFVQSAQ